MFTFFPSSNRYLFCSAFYSSGTVTLDKSRIIVTKSGLFEWKSKIHRSLRPWVRLPRKDYLARAFRIGSSRRSSDSCSSYSYELLKQSCRNTIDYSCQYINKAYEIIVRKFRLSLSLLLFHFTVVILRRGSNSSWTHLNLPILGALWWSRGRATRAMTVPFVCTPNIA